MRLFKDLFSAFAIVWSLSFKSGSILTAHVTLPGQDIVDGYIKNNRSVNTF